MSGVRAICMFDSNLWFSRMHLLPCNAQVQVFNYTKYHKFMYIIQVKGLEYMLTFHLFWFLISGYEMSPDEGQEEYEEVQADLKKREEEVSRY